MKLVLQKIVNNLSNIIFGLVLLFLLISRGPTWIQYFQNQGIQVPAVRYMTDSGEVLPLEATGKSQLLVFWATWCGPCKLEISRLVKLSGEGEIQPERVKLVSYGEDPEVVRQYLKEQAYPFQNIFDSFNEMSKFFKVQGTPTLVLLDGSNKVLWQTMGLSSTLSLRLKDLK